MNTSVERSESFSLVVATGALGGWGERERGGGRERERERERE